MGRRGLLGCTRCECAHGRAEASIWLTTISFCRSCIQDTVEQRILDLQEKKRELSRAALEGSKLKKGGNKLSLKELMYLFNGGAGDDPPVPGADELPKARARGGGGGAAAYQV